MVWLSLLTICWLAVEMFIVQKSDSSEVCRRHVYYKKFRAHFGIRASHREVSSKVRSVVATLHWRTFVFQTITQTNIRKFSS